MGERKIIDEFNLPDGTHVEVSRHRPGDVIEVFEIRENGGAWEHVGYVTSSFCWEHGHADTRAWMEQRWGAECVREMTMRARDERVPFDDRDDRAARAYEEGIPWHDRGGRTR